MSRYYYSIKGEALGPVDEAELDALAEQGVIKPNTPVIEVGGTAWSRYSALRPSNNTAVPQPPPLNESSFLDKLLGINTWIDKLLEKIFRLPSFVPSDYEGRMQAMKKMSNLTGLVIWASTIIAGFGLGGLSPDTGGAVGGGIIGLVYGLVVQYFGYQFYQMTNSLLIGQPVELSSARFPKLMGTLMIVVTLLVAVGTLAGFGSALGVGGILLALCAILPCVILTYLCMNAEGLLVRVYPESVSPGREFNNSLKFNIRAICSAIHLVTPILTILAALALFFTMISLNSKGANFGMLGAMTSAGTAVAVLLHLPFVTWLVLCLSSWLLDLLDGIFSLGGKK